MGGVHLHVRTRSAHVPSFPYLGDGCTDCAEIWCVARDPLGRLFANVYGGTQLHVRTPFSYLGNGWTDCAEIWYVVRGPVAMRFTQDGRFCTNAGVTVTHLSTSVRPRSFTAQKASYSLNERADRFSSNMQIEGSCQTAIFHLSFL